MNRIYKVEKIVKEILQENESARADDFELIAYVYNKIRPDLKDYSFNAVMLGHNELKIPPFETIRRTRQKLQAEHEELRPSKDVQIARINKTADYIKYAIE